mmetsp:Transcript_54357/g.122085  ORF Transcript_54357/g.122085 Transcript_54357/m.122085 type:complete len:750 (-) Transcript_54357:70-2319(-)
MEEGFSEKWQRDSTAAMLLSKHATFAPTRWLAAVVVLLGSMVQYVARCSEIIHGLIDLVRLLIALRLVARRAAKRPGGCWSAMELWDAAVQRATPGQVFLIDAERSEATQQRQIAGKPVESDDVTSRSSSSSSMPPPLFKVRKEVTYQEADVATNAVARWMHDVVGLSGNQAPGATVALLVPSRPECVILWMGFAKAGVASALLNPIVTAPEALTHCVMAAFASAPRPRPVIVGADEPALLLAAATAAPMITTAMEKADAETQRAAKVRTSSEVLSFYVHRGEPAASHEPLPDGFRAMLAAPGSTWESQTSPVPFLWRSKVHWSDPLLYIYTSGTTGMPKASPISQTRFAAAAQMFAHAARLRSSDRVYCALPLGHAAGGMLGVGGTLVRNAALVVRPKFSARRFASDCALHNCTVTQYIGELARYLVNAKPTMEEQTDGLSPPPELRLRCAVGNGLAADVWPEFAARLGLKRVIEFYASTEGNANLVNTCNGPIGACGVVPWFAAFVYPVILAAHDVETGELIRDKTTGLSRKAAAGEPGELLGLIKAGDPSRRFDGYTDKAASERKIARNVCKQGDAWFRSGDLLRMDAFGFYYFVDRVGDTFRWKGENVACCEVAAAVLAAGGDIAHVVVYGVAIPHHDGRAGCAALALHGGSDVNISAALGAVSCAAKERLPRAAQPKFIRITQALATTSTFKYQKVDLRKQGVDPSVIADAAPDDQVFVDLGHGFVPLDAGLWQQISAGSLRIN